MSELEHDLKTTMSLSDKINEQSNILAKGCIDEFLINKSWWKVSYLRNLNLAIFIATLSSTTFGYDGSMLNGLQSLKIWYEKMGSPNGAILGALSNGTTFGMVLIFPFASGLSDRYGRRTCVIVGLIAIIIGAILQGASTCYAFFFVSRLIIGVGSTLGGVSAPTLISEIAYPSHRSVCTTFYNVCWYLGAIVAAWVTYGTRNIATEYCWKIPSYLQGILPLIQLALIWLVPESPRYLVSRGKHAEAEKILAKYHTGDSQDPLDISFVQFELKEIEAALELENLTSSSEYLDFIKLKNFRKRLFLVLFTATMSQLSGNGLISYYLSKVLDSIGITSADKQLQINGCLMIYNFVVCSVIASVVRLFKRRTMFITCTSSMLFCFIIWTVLSAINQERNFKDTSLAKGVLAMIFLFFVSYNIGLNGLPFLYVTEIMPFSHRAKGVNLYFLWSAIVGIYNGFVNPIAMEVIEWKYYIVYCCILAVEVIAVTLFYVETSGFTLEEVAGVFGDDSIAVLSKLSSPLEKEARDHLEMA